MLHQRLANPSDARAHANAVAALMETGQLSKSPAFVGRVARDMANLDEKRDRLDHRENTRTLDTSTAQVCLRGYGDHPE